jgi:ribosome maturation factor RimP
MMNLSAMQTFKGQKVFVQLSDDSAYENVLTGTLIDISEDFITLTDVQAQRSAIKTEKMVLAGKYIVWVSSSSLTPQTNPK